MVNIKLETENGIIIPDGFEDDFKMTIDKMIDVCTYYETNNVKTIIGIINKPLKRDAGNYAIITVKADCVDNRTISVYNWSYGENIF